MTGRRRVERVGRSRAHRALFGAAPVLALAYAAGCTDPAAQKNNGPVRIERPARPESSPAQRRYVHDQAYQRGLELVDRNDFANALGAFEAALGAEPSSINALLAIGACHESLGDPFQAIRYYRRVIAINPLEYVAYTNLGTAYIKLYHHENNATWRTMALSAWRQSLALNPDQPEVREFVGSQATGGAESKP